MFDPLVAIGRAERAAGYSPSMTTTPNEPVSDPQVVPSGDPDIQPSTDPATQPGEDPGTPDAPGPDGLPDWEPGQGPPDGS